MDFEAYQWEMPDVGPEVTPCILQGRHLATAMPVRCRILSAPTVGDRSQRQRYHDQARRWARLSHRGLASLMAYGEATGDQGYIKGGDLYFISPLNACCRRLGEVLDELRWRPFLELLTDLLEALAHGHARGMVHGHLHPDLVICHEVAGHHHRRQAQIVDFGLIPRQCWRPDDRGIDAVATDHQAPEIRQGLTTMIGPHSDLYSLGSMTFRWLYGRPPGAGEQAPSRREQRHGVPPHLAHWIDRCLAEGPADRFHLAADALASLKSLDRLGSTNSPLAADPPAMPARWETERAGRSSSDRHWWHHFPTLYPFREPPMVGRSGGCHALWRSLHEVHQSGAARAVMINGSPGMGAGRLARWLEHQALALGTAHTLTIASDDDPTTILSRALQIESTDRQRLQDSIALGLTTWGARLKAADIDRADWRQLLGELTRQRPLLITITDSYRASFTLDWLAEVLGSAQAFPILFLIIVDQKELANRPVEMVQLKQLLDHPEVDDLSLGPLTQTDTVALINALLPLEEGLAFEVAQRTAGNPLVVTQLLRHWVEIGAFKPCSTRPDRLVVDDLDSIAIPEGLLEVIRWEIEAFVARFEDQAGHARAALEVAAALGMEVAFKEWREVCERLEIDVPPLFIRALFHTGTVSECYEKQSFTFEFSPVREVLQQQSKQGGRHGRIHRTCAEILAARIDHAHPSWFWSSRIGVHLAEAGALEEALQYLLDGAQQVSNQDDPRQALNLLVRYRKICDRLELAATDGRRIQGLLRQAGAHQALGDRASCQKLLAEARRRLRPATARRFLAPILWLESGLESALEVDVGEFPGADAKPAEAL